MISLQAQALSPKQIYRDSKDSVFIVLTSEGTGTAFAVSEEGLFITAAHVVNQRENLKLVNVTKGVFEVEKVLWIDLDQDLALIQGKAQGEKFKPLPLKSAQKMETGDEITVISYPGAGEISEFAGLESTLSPGMVSSIRQNFVSTREPTMEELDPVYDLEHPVKHKADEYYDKLLETCTVADDSHKASHIVLACPDGHTFMVDSQDGSMLRDDLDLAYRQDEQILYYENKNRKVSAEALKLKSSSGTMLQFTAPVSPGSSGAPVFNDAGEVIAVVNSIYTSGQNFNLGRPVDYLPEDYRRRFGLDGTYNASVPVDRELVDLAELKKEYPSFFAQALGK